MATSTAVLVRYSDPDDLAERAAVAGFLAATPAAPEWATPPICGCLPSGVPATACVYSV
jgi:hypothetical protein